MDERLANTEISKGIPEHNTNSVIAVYLAAFRYKKIEEDRKVFRGKYHREEKQRDHSDGFRSIYRFLCRYHAGRV